MLYQLLKGPLSLQEMSVQFNTSKTTLHHQLSIWGSVRILRIYNGKNTNLVISRVIRLVSIGSNLLGFNQFCDK
ncbi:hypothetical protein P4T04_11435 [Bacillus badius]|nr:hypothetical protein [Bacillus badius]MED0666925.1 hypothetical protein [Bacillus badius]